MSILSALPMAFVMIAGPQIITAIMLATSVHAKASSAAFLAGVAGATTLGLTVFYLLAGFVHPGNGESTDGGNLLNIIAIALLLVLAALAFRNRHKTDPPAWMSKIEEATPRFAFRVGFVLFVAMPTDLITMFAVSNLLAHAGDPWWHTLLFTALTVTLAGIPLLVLLAMGHRAEIVLPKVRDWITTNAWIVNEIVITLFLVICLRSYFGN